MTIQDWAAAGEIVGALAVVVTLAYLAIQIRQNTHQIRNEGHIGITDSYNELIGELLADDELFTIIVRGCHDWNNLGAFEQSRFHLFFHQHLTHFRMARRLFAKNAIDDDVYQSIEDLHLRVLANPGAQIWWNMVGESLVDREMRDLINGKLAEIRSGEATAEAWEFYNPKNWEAPRPTQS